MNLKKTLFEATGLSEGDANDIRANLPNSPFRKLFEYLLEERILQESINGPEKPITPDSVSAHRGKIEGLQIALGILNRNHNPNTNHARQEARRR